MIETRAYVTITVDNKRLINQIAEKVFMVPCIQQIDRLKQLSPTDPIGIMVVMADTIEEEKYISGIIENQIKRIPGITSVEVRFATPIPEE